MLIVYLSRSVGVFTSLYLGLHRATFQGFVQKSPVVEQEKLFFSESRFSKINWEEKDEEFEMDGKMYDVSRIEKTKGGFFVYCLNDEGEDAFISLFKSWRETHDTQCLFKPQFQPQYCNSLIAMQTDEVLIEPVFRLSGMGIYDPPVTKALSPPPRHRF